MKMHLCFAPTASLCIRVLVDLLLWCDPTLEVLITVHLALHSIASHHQK
jgi:hypothetical protein